ncbi:MAG: TonB family protein [Bacteroidales bacterium]|nr:TonB family protein [Porphyromonas sp.]MDD6933876.1 TonB family protein [Bacteroidales bacterium]MDY3102021.1 TonB family protein [Porphyromonas sp.]
MEVKKSPKANLEKGKSLSFLMGLVLALSVVFVALEWHSMDATGDGDADKVDISDIEDVMFIPDQQQQPDTPPEETPVETVEVALPEEFKVVDNDKEVAKIALVSVDEKKPLPTTVPVITQAPPQEVEQEEQIFEFVESNPVPPGGSQEALLKWIGRTLQYPEIAAENGVQGKVIVQFVVEKDGSITKATVVRGVDASLDKEALRVINKMDKWQPGKQGGKPVRVKYTLPIQFKLQ